MLSGKTAMKGDAVAVVEMVQVGWYDGSIVSGVFVVDLCDDDDGSIDYYS
jgi:hypothetical protein